MFSWFKNSRDVAEAKNKLAEEKALRLAADETAKKAAADAQSHLTSLQNAIRRAAEAEAKIRAQNEADLLMVSLQITKRILEGEKKDSPALQGLLAQQSGLQNAMPYGMWSPQPQTYTGGSLFGAIFGH